MCTWKKLWFYHSCSEHDVLALAPCGFDIRPLRTNFCPSVWPFSPVTFDNFLWSLTATVPMKMPECSKKRNDQKLLWIKRVLKLKRKLWGDVFKFQFDFLTGHRPWPQNFERILSKEFPSRHTRVYDWFLQKFAFVTLDLKTTLPEIFSECIILCSFGSIIFK